jgi:hypothetical protein
MLNTGGILILVLFSWKTMVFTVLLHKPDDVQRLSAIVHGHDESGLIKNFNDPFVFHSFAYKVNFIGASIRAAQLPDKPLPTYNNYYYGNDPSKWGSGCKVFQAVLTRKCILILISAITVMRVSSNTTLS